MTAWDYLEAKPAAAAPICDNPSGIYCPDCRACGAFHCAHPEWCGGMRLMRPRDEAIETPPDLLDALRAAYTHLTQPQRMTQTEAVYPVANYNKLTTQLRAAIAKAEGSPASDESGAVAGEASA